MPRLPFGTLALGLVASLASAQGPSWTPGFAAPSLPPRTVVSQFEYFDDGGGARLHALQNLVNGPSRVLRWSGTAWEVVFELYGSLQLTSIDHQAFGGVDRLWVVYSRPWSTPVTSEVWSF